MAVAWRTQMASELRGTELLGYRIVELIGEGGVGAVWRAEHPTLGTSVAVKVLDPLLARDAELVGRFADEARIQVQLRHENIVQVQNFSSDPLAMVMKYVPGRSLSQVIGREVGPIPFERALPLMEQILAAVGYAHEQGIVHRDLKPSNVVVTPEGVVKVMDFGIAKVHPIPIGSWPWLRAAPRGAVRRAGAWPSEERDGSPSRSRWPRRGVDSRPGREPFLGIEAVAGRRVRGRIGSRRSPS